jgi:hypothetical protein
VELRTAPRPIRQDERAHGLQLRAGRVDLLFEARDVASFEDVGRGADRSRQFGLRDEQLVLDPEELGTERVTRAVVRQVRPDDSELGSELVQRAERADPKRILGYPRATNETGLSAVAGAGVKPRGIRASGRPGRASKGELKPWTGQNEMCNTSLCFASARQSRQMNPLRSLQAIPSASIVATVSLGS